MQKEWRLCALLHWTQANSFELVVRQNHGRPQCGQNGHFPLPGIGTKNQTLLEELDVSSSIPINWFISCNDRLLDGTTTHTAQRRSYERNVTRGYEQRHNEVRWHPGKKQVWQPMFEAEVFRKQMYCIEKSTCECCDIVGTYWGPPQSFGTPILIRRPGNCAPLAPSLRTWVRRPISGHSSWALVEICIVCL